MRWHDSLSNDNLQRYFDQMIKFHQCLLQNYHLHQYYQLKAKFRFDQQDYCRGKEDREEDKHLDNKINLG